MNEKNDYAYDDGVAAVQPAAENTTAMAESHSPDLGQDLAAIKTAAAAQIQMLKGKLQEVIDAARARGEDAPNIQDIDALNIDPTGLQNPNDVAQLTAKLDSADRGIRGEQGKQMQQQVGDIVASIAGGTAIAAGGAGIAQLASLGLPEGTIKDIGDISKNMRGQVSGGEHHSEIPTRAPEISKDALAAGALLVMERGGGRGRQIGEA